MEFKLLDTYGDQTFWLTVSNHQKKKQFVLFRDRLYRRVEEKGSLFDAVYQEEISIDKGKAREISCVGVREVPVIDRKGVEVTYRKPYALLWRVSAETEWLLHWCYSEIDLDVFTPSIFRNPRHSDVEAFAVWDLNSDEVLVQISKWGSL